jgi:hypothetical protein
LSADEQPLHPLTLSASSQYYDTHIGIPFNPLCNQPEEQAGRHKGKFGLLSAIHVLKCSSLPDQANNASTPSSSLLTRPAYYWHPGLTD